MAKEKISAKTKIKILIKGWGGIFASLLLFASIITYNQNDASLNRASDGDAYNITGKIGAFLADPIMQIFGLSSVLFAIALVVWSFRTISRQARYTLWITIPSTIIMLLTFSMLCSILPVPEWWPFYVGLGGVIGDTAIKPNPHIIPKYVSFFVAFVAFIPALYFAMEMRKYEVIWLYRKIVSFCAVCSRVIYLVAIGIFNILRALFKKEPIQVAAPKPVAIKEDIVEYKPEPKKKKPALQASFKLDTGEFQLPDPDMLTDPAKARRTKIEITPKSLEQNAKLLKKVLEDFGVQGDIIKVRPGPVVTMYELEPSPGTKSSRVIGLADDIARSMSAISARIATVPGRNILGIELPNLEREVVYLRELLDN